jgi:hypothetical protein
VRKRFLLWAGVGIAVFISSVVVLFQKQNMFLPDKAKKGAEPRQSAPPTTLQSTPTSSQPIGNVSNLCKELEDKSITFNANNYPGVIGSTGIKLKERELGKFEFKTEVVFSEDVKREFNRPIRDWIIGLCQDNRITLERTLVDGTTQHYTGRIDKAGTGRLEMRGNFEDSGKSYEWSGWIDTPSQ